VLSSRSGAIHIGQPNKLTVIFGRKVTKQYRGKLQTVIEDLDLPNPVIRSHYRNGFVKQYVRDHLLLRTEPASNNVNDYDVNKAVENLPQLRERISAVIDNYSNVQQDILETFVDRGQLRKLAQPTVMPNGKRIPGLKLDHPRLLALMHALVRFSHIAAQRTFTTPENTLTRLPRWRLRRNNTVWLRSDTIFPNSGPRDWWRRFRSPAGIACCRKDIPSAWYS
jgi:hypothetical protein